MSRESLREAWRVLPFHEIADSITERIDDPASSMLNYYVGLEHLDPDSLRIRRWGAPSDVEATKLRFYPGDVIYARRRAYQRKLGVAEWDGVCSAHALVLRARPDTCLPQFLPYFLQSDQFHRRAVHISVGSLSPTINWRTLANEDFLLPPMSMQIDAVKALDSARAVFDQMEHAVERVRDVRSAVVQDATWDPFARSWGVPLRRVGDLLLEPARNGVSPREASGSNALRTVSISAIQGGRFVADDKTVKWCEPIERYAQFEVKAGDAFAVRGNGNRSLVGRVGLALEAPTPITIYPDLLIRLRFDPDQIVPRLATAIWNSRRVHAMLLQRAKSSNGIYKVNGKDIAQHLLPVPSKDQQERLEEQLAAVDAVAAAGEAHLQASRQLLVRLRESLLVGPANVQ